MGIQQKFNQSDFSHFTAEYISASIAKFTIAYNVTTESESKSIATKHPQNTCTSSKGGPGCETSYGANTEKSTHIISEVEAFNIPKLRSTLKSMY